MRKVPSQQNFHVVDCGDGNVGCVYRGVRGQTAVPQQSLTQGIGALVDFKKRKASQQL